MEPKVLLGCCSMSAHARRMAGAVAEGAAEVEGAAALPPGAFAGRTLMDGITNCSPSGTLRIVGGRGGRPPREHELAGARWRGRHAAAIAARLLR